MYYSEEITPEIVRRLTENEDTGEFYKVGAGNRIVIARQCNHCEERYYPSRKNQKYCSSSCRVMACYRRNKYTYKSGRYQKEADKNLPLDKGSENLSSIFDNEKTKSFDWRNFRETALANASVETAKYFAHDKPLMDKVDKVLNILAGNNLGSNIKYAGVQNLNGNPIGLFVDQQGFTIINDHEGRWFKLISKNPPKWQPIVSPFR